MDGQTLRKADRGRSCSQEKKEGYTKDMVPDFDEKHDEYLILLQQRNRVLKHLKTKDPMQLRLEHLEQGFSVYVNGANSELKTSPRKAVHSDFTRSASHAEGTHNYGRRTLLREAEEALRRSSRTAPSKVQRRGWHQELRKSLELSVNLQRKQRDCSSDEYDSIEEEVLSEPEPEEQVPVGHPREDPPLCSGDSVQKDVPEDQEMKGHPPQDPDPLVVLEFNPASKSNKKERNLSAKRKDNAEVFIPSRPKLNLNPQSSAVFPDQEKACSTSGSESKKDPSLWMCPFHPPLQLFFVIRNTRRLQDFGLAKIKVWNYWTADGDLDIGAKNVKLYVDESLIFDGTLDKGGGEAPADQSIPAGVEQEQDESRGRALGVPSGESREARKMAGTDGELSPPAAAVADVKLSSQGTLLGGKMNPPDCTKDSLSKLDEDASCPAALASTGGVLGPPPLCPPVERPPLDPELSLAQQLENLTSRKVSEPPAKTPSWLQPSAIGKGGKQGGRKPKPLWLSPEKPLDWVGRLVSDAITDTMGEASREVEVGDKGPRREPGRPRSWNVITGERAQKVTPKVCDDFDIFNQPSNREHPASGRRGPRKDTLISSHSDGPPTGREDTRSGKTPPRSRWCSEQDHMLHESWDSLSAFDRSQRGRISNMELQGDILDEFLQQQTGSRHSDQLPPGKEERPEPRRGPEDSSAEMHDGSDFEIPVLPYGQRLVIDIKSTWGDRHYVGLNGIEIFSSEGEPVQIANIHADPPDINVLPAYGKDPRVVTNLIDGVNRTQDDMHVWLAPFTLGKPHSISIDFVSPCQVALIRIWNYNKSRIHSFRGVKDITMLLDAQCIFKGEIAKASGTLTGAPEHFGDTILFTTDDDILEAIFCLDETFDVDAESPYSLQSEETPRRPSTAGSEGEDRPYTQAGPWAEDQ
ncbi:protein KIAA0556 homolog, partial [Leptonychotes weddellii]|uniref:Protein KIAA0556 homolog n=1 Tax=Leptonychotes weddellii TaxID=9713 RepID=A0A7F8PWI0_LEPWE